MSTTPSEAAGRNIRAEMARRDLSQTALAAQLGISQSQLSKRLKGHIAFDVNELHAIAQLLDVPPSTLLPTEASVA